MLMTKSFAVVEIFGHMWNPLILCLSFSKTPRMQLSHPNFRQEYCRILFLSILFEKIQVQNKRPLKLEMK